jgi:hypothetical protein
MVNRDTNRLWCYEITKPVTIPFTTIVADFDSDWLSISKGRLTVKASVARPYAWDGCSPKCSFFDLFVIGTPDGRTLQNGDRITKMASLIHDVLCQYVDDLPLTRRDIDLVFYELLRDANFKLSLLYYCGVRLWSTIKRGFMWIFQS